MDELTWELLDEASGSLEADAIQSLLEAEGIPVQLFQESIGRHAYPVAIDGLGRVQIFVPKDKATEAREWLKVFRDGSEEYLDQEKTNKG
ncbi:MAG: DUF2007 domain-containing protein [Chloroflexi bacterium]|nr:DUF2007 domain-containing protein [Chloroflexota bacterium]